MKRIFFLMAAMLAWNVASQAGDLKIAVPVDEFKKMQARLEALEQENNQLKQGDRHSAAAASATATDEMHRLQVMESENARLRQEISGLKGSQSGSAVSAEIQAKLDSLAKENNQLKDAVRTGGGSAAGQPEVGLQARLATVESDNDRLRQEVKLLQAGDLAEVYGENKISAREEYFLARRKNVSHVFKF